MSVGDWVGVLGGLAALIGAGVAVWQARDARRARKEAREASAEASQRAEDANAAFGRMASAQETLAQASRPKAWGQLQPYGGDLWAIRNTSERAITLLRVDVSPDQARPLLEMEALPQTHPAGDIVEFAARSRLSLSIRKITLVWHFADEPESAVHDSARMLGGGPSQTRSAR